MAEAVALPSLDADSVGPYGEATRERAWSQVRVALQEHRGFSVDLAMPGFGAQQRDVLLGIFDLPDSSLWHVARRSVRPDSTFEWVGYGYHCDGPVTLHQTFDLGPWGAAPVAEATPYGASDAEVTPLPHDLASEWLPVATGLRNTLGATGRDLVSLIAWGLGRDPSMAASRFQPDDSTLRVLDYPDAEHPATGSLRAAEHEDSGALTFIWSDAPGLQLRTAHGDWVEAVPDSWSVICGHGMSEMTDGAISATTHRVVPGAGRRRSVAYFFEPRRDASVLPWPAVGETEPEPGPHQTYGAWLARRHGG